MKNHVIRLAALLLLALTAAANPFGVGVLLVPVNPGTLNGANGAQWVTRLWIHNPSDSIVRIENDDVTILPAGVLLSPHTTVTLGVPYSNIPHPGFFLHTRTENGFFSPADVMAELRTLDSANASHSAGTSIPMPALDDFRTGTTALPNIPANGHSRIRLRLYGVSNTTTQVRTYDGAQLLRTDTVALTGEDPAGGRAPRYPSYAELEITVPAATDSLRVEFDSVTTPVWGFISVTDDVTNEFTVVAPHVPHVVVLSVA